MWRQLATGPGKVDIIVTSMRKLRRLRLMLTGVGVVLVVFGLAQASASSANISHAYRSNSSIKNGSLVSLDSSRSDYIVPANVNNGAQLLGVAVVASDSLIAVNVAPGTVQVATTGIASTLVSTLNGNIGVGDQVAVSPFNGVGMKASPGSRVIGLAQTAFNGGTSGATTEVVRTKDGQSRSVRVGYLRLNISIGTDATVLTTNTNSLQKAVQNVTGHNVPTARIIISLTVAIIALLALITLIYASIYGSIVSIGRNPLAKYAVFRTLGSVLGLALLTAVVSGLTIYFLLR